MVELQMTNQHPKLDDSALDMLEKHVGFALPQAYRQFLLKHNGGIPSPNCFVYYDPIDDKIERRSIDEFFHIGNKYDFYSVYAHVGKGIIPDDALAIAYDGQQGTIFISYAVGDEGRIYLHANWIEPEEVNIFLLGESFEDFLQKLFFCNNYD
jgi:hypothetical protein